MPERINMGVGLRSITLTVARLLLLSAMIHVSEAFSVTHSNKPRDVTHSTTAIRYTMQMPDFAVGLPKSTWYDVANPTARRIVYDDGPTEFMFATVGNNWPELNDVPTIEEEPEPAQKKPRQPWSRMKPLRRARNLIRRFL